MRRRGRPRIPVQQREPLLRELLLAIEASGQTHEAFCAEAGVRRATLTLLRRGDMSTTVTLMTVNHLARAVGLKLALVPDEGAQ